MTKARAGRGCGERGGLKPQEFAGVGQGGRGDDFAAEKAGDFANAGFAVYTSD